MPRDPRLVLPLSYNHRLFNPTLEPLLMPEFVVMFGDKVLPSPTTPASTADPEAPKLSRLPLSLLIAFWKSGLADGE